MILPDTYLTENRSPLSRILTIYPNESWIYGYIEPSNSVEINKRITKTSRILGPFSINDSDLMLYYNIDKKREFNKIATKLVSSALRQKIEVTGNITLFKYQNHVLVDITYEDFSALTNIYHDTKSDDCGFSLRHSGLKLKFSRLCQKFKLSH